MTFLLQFFILNEWKCVFRNNKDSLIKLYKTYLILAGLLFFGFISNTYEIISKNGFTEEAYETVWEINLLLNPLVIFFLTNSFLRKFITRKHMVDLNSSSEPLL